MATKNQTAGQKAAATKAANKVGPAVEAPKPAVKPPVKPPVKAANPSPAPDVSETPVPKAIKPKAKAEPVEVKESPADTSDAAEETGLSAAGRLEFADALRKRLHSAGFGMTPKMAKEAVKAFEETVESFLSAGSEINFPGFGKFKLTYREACERRNPRDGEIVQVPAQVVTAFKAGTTLKKAAAEAMPFFQ